MLSSGLTERGYQIYVIDISKSKHLNSRFYSVYRSIQLLIPYVKYVLFLLFSRVDVVYMTIAQSKAGFFRDLPFVALANFLNIKTVLHLKGGNYHGFYENQSKLVKLLVKYMLDRSSKIIVLGEALIEMYNFHSPLKDKVVVVRNGLPVEGIQSKAKEQSPNKQLGILYLSNLIQSKGYFDLVKSIRILRDVYGVQVKLTLAGEIMLSSDDPEETTHGELKQQLSAYIDSNNMNDLIQYVGPVSGDAKWDLYKEHDIFCLPTNYIYEGQPVSIIEAIAHGCAIISTNFRAIPEMLVDGANGYIVQFGNPKDIADKVMSIINNSQISAMSSESLRLYETKFTRKTHLDNIINEIIN